MTNSDTTMETKVISKLIKWGNNEAEVIAMVKAEFQNAINYGYKTPAKIAEYIRTMA